MSVLKTCECDQKLAWSNVQKYKYPIGKINLVCRRCHLVHLFDLWCVNILQQVKSFHSFFGNQGMLLVSSEYSMVWFLVDVFSIHTDYAHACLTLHGIMLFYVYDSCQLSNIFSSLIHNGNLKSICLRWLSYTDCVVIVQHVCINSFIRQTCMRTTATMRNNVPMYNYTELGPRLREMELQCSEINYTSFEIPLCNSKMHEIVTETINWKSYTVKAMWCQMMWLHF